MSSGPTTKRPRRWRRVLAWGGLGLLVLIFVGWFVVTSEPFLKKVVLPRVGSLIHAELTAEEVKLEGLSSVHAHGVHLMTEPGVSLIEVDELEVHFRLSDLLDKIIGLDEIRLVHPQVIVSREKGGKNTLSAWIAEFKRKPKPATQPKPKQTLQFAIGNVSIVDGELEYVRRVGGQRDLRLFADRLNFSVDQFRNGETTGGDLSLRVLVEHLVEGTTTNDFLQASLETSARVDIAENLMPTGLEADLDGHMIKALGRFRESFGLDTKLAIRSSAGRLKSISADFSRDGTEVGSISAIGELDYRTRAGELDITTRQIPPVVIELLSLKSGWDIDMTMFNSTNHIVFGGRGGQIQSKGNATISGLNIRTRRGEIPRVDVNLDFDAVIEPSAAKGALNAFVFSVATENSGRATASIDEPFLFAWSESLGSETASRMNIVVENVGVNEWQGFTGDIPVEGRLNLRADVHSRNAGQSLAITGSTELLSASLAFGTNTVDQLHGELAIDATIDQFQTMSIESSTLKVSLGELEPVAMDVSGPMRFKNFQADLKTGLTIPASTSSHWVDGIPDWFREEIVTFDGEVALGNRGVAVDGKVGTSPVDITVGPKELVGAHLEIPISIDFADGALKWNLKEIALHDRAGPVQSLSSSGHYNIRERETSIAVEVPIVTTELINSFATNYLGGLSLSSGVMSAGVQGDIGKPDGQRWSGYLASTNVVFVDKDGAPATGVIGDRTDFEAVINLAREEFELLKFNSKVYSDGIQCGEFDASGDLRITSGEAELKIRIKDLDEHALRPIAPLIIGERRLENIDVDTRFDLNYKEGEPSVISTAIEINDLLVKDPNGHYPSEKRSLKLEVESDLGDRRIDISSAQLRSAPTENASNVIRVSGWIDYEDIAALRGDVTVESAALDITPVYDLLSRPRPEQENEDQFLEIAEMRSGGGSAQMPFDDFNLALDVQELYFRELLVTNWVASLNLGKHTANLELFSLSLNGAPINFLAQLTSDQNHFDYAIAGELEQVPLYPVVKAFYPDWLGLAKAEIYSAIDLKGRVERDSSLWSTASGHLYVGVTNAYAELLSQRWQNVLRPVGLMLQTPELFSSPVNWIYAHTEIGDDEIRLHQHTIMADAYIADLSADIPLAADFVSSPIPSVPVGLYLSRNLLTQLNIIRDEEDTSSYVSLPDFLYLNGTFAEPTVEIDKLKTSGMVLSKAGDFVGGTAGDVLKGAGEITEGIGGILSGRKLVGEDVQLGPVSHGVDFLFRSIGSVFGGTGEAVDKGTGAVTGTEVVDNENMTNRFHSFDWPRQFTNAPNSVMKAP